MSVLENFVRLKRNAETRLRLRNPRREPRTITDPKTKAVKTVNAWVADCFEEDGIPVSKSFSTIAEKLAGQLEAISRSVKLENVTVGIVWRPADFATEYEVHVL